MCILVRPVLPVDLSIVCYYVLAYPVSLGFLFMQSTLSDFLIETNKA